MTITMTPPPRPKRLLKWAFNLPCYLYRWHLGWLLGHRVMMITHIGRKTGTIRRTVVEAVHYDPKTRTCLALAGYGEKTDWYRNILAHPAFEIHVGSSHYRPQQQLLSTEELMAVLKDYERRYPRMLRLLLLHLLGYAYDGSAEGLRTVAQTIRGVTFCPLSTNSILE